MKSSDNLTPRRKRLWGILRFAVPPRVRWFYEGHPALRGQLWYAERKVLYQTIKKYRPAVCFEIGTWKGGGSTLFISQALHDNRQGHLHTIEIDRDLRDEALRKYEQYLPHLVPFVTFHLGDYRERYGEILEETGGVDFLILDGPEDADETLRQYNFFLPYMKPGTVLMAHDWFTEKARLLKQQLTTDNSWSVLKILSPPASVGLALAIRQ
jgi:predicted O-methyltransferase YrrM